jgi:hypothetical protein
MTDSRLLRRLRRLGATPAITGKVQLLILIYLHERAVPVWTDPLPIARIAVKCGTVPDVVQRALRKLKAHGLISSRPKDANGFGRPLQYKLCPGKWK